jgi:transposase-like protein
VNADGHREILGIDVLTSEDGAGWLAFFRDLVARGLSGIKLVTSDAHAGLVAAIGATLGGAAWQRSSVQTPGRREGPARHPHRRERTLFLAQLLAAYPAAPVVVVTCDNVIIHRSKLVQRWLAAHPPWGARSRSGR